MDLLDWLGPADFVPRGQCGQWGHLWVLSVVANGAIAVSYFVISLTLLSRWAELAVPQRIAGAAFAAFIWSCGFGHACQAMSFGWPAYRLFLLVDMATAGLSMCVAAASPIVVAMLFKAALQRRSRVLVIDDSRAGRRILRDLIEDGGYDVVTVATLAAGFENARRFDAVVADVVIDEQETVDDYSHLTSLAAVRPTLAVSRLVDAEAAKSLGVAYADKLDGESIMRWLAGVTKGSRIHV